MPTWGARHGNGGASALRNLGEDDLLQVHTLKPGQKLLVDDRLVEHTGTRLEPAEDGSDAFRRTIVWLVDFQPIVVSLRWRLAIVSQYAGSTSLLLDSEHVW